MSAHGDVVQLTNNTGTSTKTYSYDSFGVETAINDNDTNPFRYCGEYYDKETGSYYLRARYYNPQNGRFSSEDTIHSVSKKMPNGQELVGPLSLNLCGGPNGETGVRIHINGKGNIHGYPVNPNQYLQNVKIIYNLYLNIWSE